MLGVKRPRTDDGLLGGSLDLTEVTTKLDQIITKLESGSGDDIKEDLRLIKLSLNAFGQEIGNVMNIIMPYRNEKIFEPTPQVFGGYTTAKLGLTIYLNHVIFNVEMDQEVTGSSSPTMGPVVSYLNNKTISYPIYEGYDDVCLFTSSHPSISVNMKFGSNSYPITFKLSVEGYYLYLRLSVMKTFRDSQDVTPEPYIYNVPLYLNN